MRSFVLFACLIISFMLAMPCVSGQTASPPVASPSEAGADPAENPTNKPNDNPSDTFDDKPGPVPLGRLGEIGVLLLDRGAAHDPARPDGLPGDRLLLETDGTKKPEVLFEAPGRVIEDAIVGNLDAQGDPEIVLLLDSCGSGGFRDIVVLARGEKGLRPIHEEGGFKSGRVILADRKDTKGTDVVISSLGDFVAGAAFPRWKTKVLAMDANRLVENQSR